MPLGLNTLTTVLDYFGGRKVQSSPNSTHRPNIFARRHPRVARSRSTRLHAAKSAARLHKHRSNATANSTNRPSATANTGTAHGKKQRQAKMRPFTDRKPLRRCNTALIPQPPTHPQPPGAFVVEPSFIVPGFPELDHRNLPAFITLKLFFDAVDEGRQTLLRAEEERKTRDEEAKNAHRLEQASEKARARAAHRKEVEKEYAKLLEENWRKAEAARRKAEHEEFVRLLQENARKAQEAQRRAIEQEERRRQAERKRQEEERRERERREEEHRRQEERRREEERLEEERREKERLEREAAQSNLKTRLRIYEEKWAALRSNDVRVENLSFYDLPWPSFEDVRDIGDITEERVLEFVRHLHEHKQGHGRGLPKFVRSEMLRWHPDKFDATVLGMVVECHREAVREAAGHVTCILITLSDPMR